MKLTNNIVMILVELKKTLPHIYTSPFSLNSTPIQAHTPYRKVNQMASE